MQMAPKWSGRGGSGKLLSRIGSRKPCVPKFASDHTNIFGPAGGGPANHIETPPVLGRTMAYHCEGTMFSVVRREALGLQRCVIPGDCHAQCCQPPALKSSARWRRGGSVSVYLNARSPPPSTG